MSRSEDPSQDAAWQALIDTIDAAIASKNPSRLKKVAAQLAMDTVGVDAIPDHVLDAVLLRMRDRSLLSSPACAAFLMSVAEWFRGPMAASQAERMISTMTSVAQRSDIDPLGQTFIVDFLARHPDQFESLDRIAELLAHADEGLRLTIAGCLVLIPSRHPQADLATVRAMAQRLASDPSHEIRRLAGLVISELEQRR